jgi:hypothetical protein
MPAVKSFERLDEMTAARTSYPSSTMVSKSWPYATQNSLQKAFTGALCAET